MPRFEDFPALAVYQGPVKPPQFRRTRNLDELDFPDRDPHCAGLDASDSRRFYGKMRPNFAGHYVVAGCTCGTGCHYLLMWDALTGEVIRNLPFGTINVGPYFEGDDKQIEYVGEEHRVTSTLLMVEGCIDQDVHPNLRECGRRYYVWKNRRLVRLAK